MIDQHVPKPQAAADVKELRLALVCYGGVSLAIYMHGITKEIHKLVRASEQFNEETARGRAVNPFPESTMEHVYWNALAARAEAQQVRTRVVVDVIAGTSAGGINGICLAKALAGNRSQDALRNLWFDHGDIDGLLNTPGWVKGRFPKFAWVAVNALKREPLKGQVMAQWVYDACRNMDGQQPAPESLTSLMPERLKVAPFATVPD